MLMYIDYFANMSINVKSNFIPIENVNLVLRIEYEVLASLILKKMENHPNLFELWDHLFEK